MSKKTKVMLWGILITIVLFLIIGILIYITLDNEKPYIPGENPSNKTNGNYIETIKYNVENEINGYDERIIRQYDKQVINDYEVYQYFLNENKITSDLTKKEFQSKSYIIVYAENDYCGGKVNGIRSVQTKDKKINIDIGYNGSCGPCPTNYTLYIVPINKFTEKEYMVNYKYTLENKYHCDPMVAYKPIIYLYPKNKTRVTVKLLKPENLTVTYPKYQNQWNVTAYPNGQLKDNQSGRKLYGLYWEGKNYESTMQKEGFVVKGTNTISFLEEKLKELGLTEREANEFIIYWLPQLEQNNYNYIYFNTHILNKIMPLEINPQPDTIIRILMEYKPLNKPIKIKKQRIKTPIRNGFTIVEWGGTIIN